MEHRIPNKKRARCPNALGGSRTLSCPAGWDKAIRRVPDLNPGVAVPQTSVALALRALAPWRTGRFLVPPALILSVESPSDRWPNPSRHGDLSYGIRFAWFTWAHLSQAHDLGISLPCSNKRVPGRSPFRPAKGLRVPLAQSPGPVSLVSEGWAVVSRLHVSPTSLL